MYIPSGLYGGNGVKTDLTSDYHAPHYDFVFSFLLRSLNNHILNNTGSNFLIMSIFFFR